MKITVGRLKKIISEATRLRTTTKLRPHADRSPEEQAIHDELFVVGREMGQIIRWRSSEDRYLASDEELARVNARWAELNQREDELNDQLVQYEIPLARSDVYGGGGLGT